MKLTTKGRFAVTAMLDIAMHEHQHADTACSPVSLAEISERQQISLSYLEQLFGKLRRNGLVSSIRGPGGGYQLALPAESISVSQIISAVDETIDATQCGGNHNCNEDGPCMTHDLWSSLNQKILSYLSGINLSDMVATQVNNQQVITPPNLSSKTAKAECHTAKVA